MCVFDAKLHHHECYTLVRELDAIRQRLALAEESVQTGEWVTQSPEEILLGIKESAARDKQV